MKNKPTKHKESNTFKFVPFAERIGAIDVDVFHQIDRRRGIEDEGEKQTFFFLALEKWSVLNCTESYSDFRKRLPSPGDVETLPQLLLQSEEVAKTLLKSLTSSDYLSLQPVLECVIALAKDLRHDFYPFFPAFLIRIVNILTAPVPPEGRGQKEAEIAEWCLTCLAHLCKILWRSMLKDWDFVYGSLLLPLILVKKDLRPKKVAESNCDDHGNSDNAIEIIVENEDLRMDVEEIEENEVDGNEFVISTAISKGIDEKKIPTVEESYREKLMSRPPPVYVRDFVVQSFAFVARKSKDKLSFLESVLTALKSNKSGVSGTGLLLSEVMKGVQGHFHSCADSLLPLVLHLGCRTSDECVESDVEEMDEIEKSIAFQLIKHVLVDVMSTIHHDKGANLLWKSLLDLVKQSALQCKTDPCDDNQVRFLRSIKFLQIAVDFNGGRWLSSDIAHPRTSFGSTTQVSTSLPLSHQLSNVIISAFQPPAVTKKIALEVGILAGSILCSPAVTEGRLRLGQEVAAKLTNQVLTYPDTSVIINFVQKTTSFSGFETLVLPHLMFFCYSCCSKVPGSSDFSTEDVIHLLASLILKKAPPCTTGGSALNSWKQYPLDIKKSSAVTSQSVETNFLDELRGILSIPVTKDFSRLDVYISSLIIFPHLKEVKDLGKVLVESIDVLISMVEKTQEIDNLKKEELFFILSESLIAAALAKDDEGLISRLIPFDKILKSFLIHCTTAGRVPMLRALDIYLTTTITDINIKEGNSAILTQIYEALHVNLASPYREVCRLTLHLLSEIEKTLNNIHKIFGSCLAVEELPLTVQNVREKVGLLEALKPVLSEKESSSSLESASLQYLIGVNFVNFRLIWEPTCKLLASHGRACPNHFWNIFAKQLRLSVAYVKIESGCKSEGDEMKLAAQIAKKWESRPASCLSNSEFLQEWYAQRFTLSDSPDFVNYRIQLLNTMSEASDICEMKNRDVSEIFLTFFREEFMKSDSKIAPTWDIRKSEEDMETNDDELEHNELEENALNVARDSFNIRFSSKTLVAFLSLLSKMKNPRAMYKEPELAKIYQELLSHRNPEIQKHTLDCLLAYRCKLLLPYRENLYNLIDEKKFKSELNLFRIDKESELVKEEHRTQLMPIIMQVLYSKMQSGNKRTGHLRRSLVLRFIAGCHDAEIVIFLKMAFGLLSSYVEDSSEEVTSMVRKVMTSVDLEKAVHPKRLLSTSNLLLVVLERLGNLLLPHRKTSDEPSEALNFLLRCLLCTNALIAGEYAKRDLIHPCHLTSLRSARASGLAAVATFFRRLEYYPWSVSLVDDGMVVGDLEALFEACIWPWLDQLPMEGIHSPTALLKLFMVWSENPRYFPLMAKKRFSEAAQFDSVIPSVLSLLSGNKAKPSVVNAILDMIERLITYASEDETGIPMEILDDEDALPALPSLDVGPIVELKTDRVNNLQLSHKLNFGSTLILPHVPCIVGVLYQRFRSLKKGSSPSARDLRVLSILSELVWEPEDSEALVQLIIPIAIHKASRGATGEQMCQLLLTAKNLLRNVPNPFKFLRSIAPLFSLVDGHNARSILCQILETVVSQEKRISIKPADKEVDTSGGEDEIENIIFQEDLKMTSRVICDLNSWDPSKLEEPDYSRRLETYKKLKEIKESVCKNETKYPLLLGILLIHNSFHVLKNEKDMSLRESAGHCLQTLAPLLSISVSENRNCRNLVVAETLLFLITKTLKNRKASDSLLYETIGTLRAMVHECPNLHPILKDLSRLACKSDPEIDFFENIRHLQIHRRGRALMRFVQDTKDAVKPMAPQTLTGIILPLAFNYLFNPRYAKNNSLVDSAIEAVGAACYCLPWHHYEAILKHQLGRLHRETVEFGRQPIRLIVAILNNFHFNLSRADVDAEVVVSNEKQENDLSQVENELNQTIEAEEKPEEIIGTEVEEEELIENEKCSDLQVEEIASSSQDLLLPAAAARRARKALSSILLPRLHASLVAPTERDSSHKLNRKAGGAIGAELSSEKEKRKDGPRDEEETLVMRVPIALAAVKMLQRLPSDFMTQHLSSVLLKVLAFLKCRLESVRRVAREILVEIGISLGPKFLSVIIKEMTSLLIPTRGYAFHVLAFTAHSLLVSISPLMQQGDINKCLSDFLEICKADLFGMSAEEKVVTKITSKVYEARSHKSYDSFQLLAKVVSESCLIDLIQPLKEVLDETHSYKFVKIVKECLSRVAKGLVENKFVSSASLLTFSFGVLSQNISALWPRTPAKTEKPIPRRSGGAYAGVSGIISQPLTVPSDPYLIPKEPRKARIRMSGTVDRVGAQANAHALTEFGLHLLSSLLKKEQIRWRKDVEICDLMAPKNEISESSEIIVMNVEMLDPLLPIVCECLESHHAKITTLALNCFRIMVKLELPSMDKHLVKAAEAIYAILHKYAGATSGDNYNLAVSAFKAVAILVRSVKSLPVEEDHLSALLTYVSRDLDLGGEVGSALGGSGPARTATAFGVLRSILARKLRSPLIPPLMKRVAKLSVVAEATHIQVQSRQVFLQFLLDYPMNKKKLDNHVAFYLGQLNYKLLSGRESALEFIQSVISVFPPIVVRNFSGTVFVSLAARLIEEEVPECKRKVAAIIKAMLLRLSRRSRDSLFDILVIWMKDSKVTHQELAVQLCGIFVLAEGDSFSSRLSIVLPLITEQLKGNEYSKEIGVNYFSRLSLSEPKLNGGDDTDVDKYVKLSHKNEMDAGKDSCNEEDSLKSEDIKISPVDNDLRAEDECLEQPDEIEVRDHHLFQLFQLILKIFMTCPAALADSKWKDHINEIAIYSQNMLAYPHEWVRLASSQVLGSVFGSIDPSQVAIAALMEKGNKKKTKTKKKKNNVEEEKSNGIPFLFTGVEARLKSLILDLCAQLESSAIGPHLAEQVVKNLVFLARVLKNVEELESSNEEKSDLGPEKEFNVTLSWMIRKMRKIVNTEVTQTPNITVMRSAVFKWLAAISLELSSDTDRLKPHLHQILSPIIREVEHKTSVAGEPKSKEVKELRRLAYEVCELIKEKVGLEIYAEVVRNIQAQLTNKRAERKRIRAQEVVSMPEKAAKRKIKKQLAKKQLKRRKINVMKGRKFSTKKMSMNSGSIF